MKSSSWTLPFYFIRSCASGQLPGCSCDKLIGKRRRQVQLSLSGHITCVLCFCVCLLCVCVFSWISLAMLHLFYARCLQLIKFTVKVSIVDMNILRGRLVCCQTRFFCDRGRQANFHWDGCSHDVLFGTKFR